MTLTENLDIRIHQDGTTVVSFWDNNNGNDVILVVDDKGGMKMNNEKVTFKDFINKIKEVSKEPANTSGF